MITTLDKSKKIKNQQKIMSKNDGKIDTAFSFKWDNTAKKSNSKVFARKRKSNVSSDVIQDKSKISNDEGNLKDTNQTETFTFVDNKNASYEQTGRFIKRKMRKDKQMLANSEEKGKSVVNDPYRNKNIPLFNEKLKTIYVSTSKTGISVSEDLFTSSGRKFSDLDIHRHLVSNLEKNNLLELTNVQEKSIPIVMSGKDTLIRSQTGSGKTLAYAVPIVEALQGITPPLRRTDGAQAIIVVPTRELALQTHELFGKINTFQRVVVSYLCGGENRKTEKDRLRKGLNVLIGTPGRLLDHVLHTAAFKIDKVRCLVLDEADRLLDMGFKKDIVRLVEELKQAKANSSYDPIAILKSTQNKISSEKSEEINEDIKFPLKNIHSKLLQTILLSATLTPAVSELVDFIMNDHVYVDALDLTSNIIANSLVIPDTVKQEVIVTYVKHRLFTLSALIVAKSKENSKMFVFMASSQMVEFHYNLFTKYLVNLPKNRGKIKEGNVALLYKDFDDEEEDEEEVVLDVKFFKLHGSMDQKMRKEVFTAFRAAKKGVLICTDVAARGIDVPTAHYIVQYTGPQTDEDYLHRVGRTGRAGKSGAALIFLTHEEQDYITRLQEHRVFLKKKNPEEYLQHLCDLMEEPDYERAATALQRRFESAVAKDKELYREACFAYSTWSRFYNSYPAEMRSIFDFKKLNLGHYVTSFAIRDTPSAVARVVRGQVASIETPKLNKKLANHQEERMTVKMNKYNKGKKSNILTTSEYSSGPEPVKKKKKKKNEDEIEEINI